MSEAPTRRMPPAEDYGVQPPLPPAAGCRSGSSWSGRFVVGSIHRVPVSGGWHLWVGVLEPFPVHPLDADDVDRAVRRMAGHVGLQGLRFDVTLGRLESGTGAEIALQRGQVWVPIRVSGAAASFPPALLALLAHQLSHKVLFDRGIVLEGGDLESYEVLTEATAVFLGMGKLLLNGYEFAVTERDWDRLLEVRHQHRFGYVTGDEVAFTHAMLCRMRAVPEVEGRLGLSRFALEALARVASDPAIRSHLARAHRIAPRASYV